MHPKQVREYVQNLLAKEESNLGLPPVKGMSDADRVKRITNSGIISPEMYDALYGREGEHDY